MKIWSSKLADKKFSEAVRSVGVCQRPDCPYCKNQPGFKGLQCSHFWGRNHSSTRYDFDNCDCFCAGTHFMWEGEKAGCYREYMLKKLGKKKYKLLEEKHNKMMPRREAILELMGKLK